MNCGLVEQKVLVCAWLAEIHDVLHACRCEARSSRNWRRTLLSRRRRLLAVGLSSHGGKTRCEHQEADMSASHHQHNQPNNMPALELQVQGQEPETSESTSRPLASFRSWCNAVFAIDCRPSWRSSNSGLEIHQAVRDCSLCLRGPISGGTRKPVVATRYGGLLASGTDYCYNVPDPRASWDLCLEPSQSKEKG